MSEIGIDTKVKLNNGVEMPLFGSTFIGGVFLSLFLLGFGYINYWAASKSSHK
ncbi:MAG: hypothetical protein KAW09_08185 [Thermoplasmata archaeon]|nr:hypothetical protein [Thermoplasmata archaeon]